MLHHLAGEGAEVVEQGGDQFDPSRVVLDPDVDVSH